MITKAETGFGWNQRPPLSFGRQAQVAIARAQIQPKPLSMSSKVRETVFDTSRFWRL